MRMRFAASSPRAAGRRPAILLGCAIPGQSTATSAAAEQDRTRRQAVGEHRPVDLRVGIRLLLFKMRGFTTLEGF
jgi:hypothetical protein